MVDAILFVRVFVNLFFLLNSSSLFCLLSNRFGFDRVSLVNNLQRA
ncbi:hypothetical protein LEP1GSC068_0164 [Leptospira sp. Fiocruz LV3954]|nr:hypothetical protein LEP1GSC068_0164 [Leptospira sp. Fiocruz LV3954]EMI70001.1 hypothetical protein LEP1GSC076_3786 [Leptospira sp. Fiocruz LV4135]